MLQYLNFNHELTSDSKKHIQMQAFLRAASAAGLSPLGTCRVPLLHLLARARDLSGPRGHLTRSRAWPSGDRCAPQTNRRTCRASRRPRWRRRQNPLMALLPRSLPHANENRTRAVLKKLYSTYDINNINIAHQPQWELGVWDGASMHTPIYTQTCMNL